MVCRNLQSQSTFYLSPRRRMRRIGLYPNLEKEYGKEREKRKLIIEMKRKGRKSIEIFSVENNYIKTMR
jgi:hypothetical protein